MVRRVLIGLLAAGMIANGVLLADALLWGLVVPVAEAEPEPASAGPEARKGEQASEEPEEPEHPALRGEEIARATYRRLIDEVSAHRDRLEARAEELSERERQLGVAQQELQTERERLEALREKVRQETLDAQGQSAPSFERLLKAYEGMEPENAAAALAQLYQRDRDVVVDVLLGLRSRQAALVLDAVAAGHPQIAADLSLEIWQKDPRRQN
jgi:flagellar motility protein MotE (MotC chaperone)